MQIENNQTTLRHEEKTKCKQNTNDGGGGWGGTEKTKLIFHSGMTGESEGQGMSEFSLRTN